MNTDLLTVLKNHSVQNEAPSHVKEDIIALSNSTPINVGVRVGAHFTLSFLYKITPIGSWVQRTILWKGDAMYNYDEGNGKDFLNQNSDFDNYIP
ncbi:PIR Superfamily Protein [Plasmodium ovale curtisi]|uniref:PIR Superfamily Protein n=1 Tax=Plasmodium ovale curtisi TaxID=864141 RepID=A0A1A8WSQ4_PLAOA|nr:PIR Superfamily Protein [Plasmodium ovale curtisi]SBS99030.1 PIR Superfamily Protein [Plasmodium ovale curtisi]